MMDCRISLTLALGVRTPFLFFTLGAILTSVFKSHVSCSTKCLVEYKPRGSCIPRPSDRSSEESTMSSPPASPTAFVVNSPRRTLSLVRERRGKAKVSISDPEEKASGFAAEHGPKPTEVYGFVGSITTVITTVIYLVWAYTPEPWLHWMGITYYPSKYWALAFPVFVTVTLVLAMTFYLGMNFMVTPPPTSFNTMFDEYSRERSKFASSAGTEQQIEPISDIGINQINDLMFANKT